MDRKNLDELIRRGDLEDLSAAEPLQPPRDLLPSILEKTSGPACGRVEALLAQGLLDDTEDLDTQLVSAHADGCAACDALRAVFSQLALDLRAMRDLEPDAGFADAVCKMTTQTAGGLRSSLVERCRSRWEQLVQRPRFAWETAYVGALLFWLVLSLPLVSLPDARPVMQALRDPVLRWNRQVWRSTHSGWSTASTQVQQDLRRHTDDLRVAIDSLEVERGGEALVEFAGDAREAVHRFIRRDKTATTNDRSEP